MANIDQTKELNKLLEEQAKIYAAQEKSLKNQLNITQQLVRLMQGLDLDGMATNANDLGRAIDEAAQSLENMGNGQQTTDEITRSLAAAIEESDEFGDSLANLGKKFLKLAPVVGTLEGIVGGFRLLGGAMNTVLSVGNSVITALFNIGAAILAAPFRLLGFLMGQAARGGGAELRQAIEDVRKEFGDLAKNESRAIMDAWRRVDHFGGQLAETGLSIWRTMGNMAESMKAIHEIATQLGPTFSNLKGDLADNAQRIFAYQKGLGLSEEAMAGFGRRAQALGVSITEVGREVTQMAYGMGEAFGINGKMIGRDVGEMIADFENFGNIAVSELAEIAVFARKLGVEVKALLGVIDTFDNFEDAATSVAQLSQAFGLQLDTLELVQAQNPAERIEALRKSFFAAGQSIENMTRQERALLATQTGLDQNTLQLVFSQKNASLSYEQIQKQSESTEKQQISQAEAMQKLANSIERLVRSGGQMESSFFKIFIDGFARGVRWTREWWGLMWNLRRAMRSVRWAGVRVGQAFVKYFPGVKDFLGGLRDLFDRRRWHKMLFGGGGIVNIFRDFFKAIAGNDPRAVTNLIDRLKENFFNWFSSSEGAGRRILDGFKNFTKAFLRIGGQLFAEAMKALGQAFKGIAGFIRNPEQALGRASEATDGVLGFLMDALRPAFEAIVEAWPALKEGFMELVTAAWERIKPAITGFLQEHWPKILAVLFGPAIIGGAVRGLAFGLGSMLISGLKGGVGMLTRGGGSIIGKAFSKLGGAGASGDVAKGGANARVAGQAAGGLSRTIEELGRTRITGRAVANMALLGTVISVGLMAIVTGLVMLADYIQKSGITARSIASAGLAMTAAGLVMIEIAGVIRILSGATQGLKAGPLITGILAVGAVGTAMAFGMVGLIELFKDVTSTEIMVTLGAMTAATIMVAEIALAILGMGIVGQLTQSFAAQIAIGLLSIGIVGGLMALGAIGLIEAFRGYSESDISKTVSIMDATGRFFLAAIAVTIGAGVIGAIMTATSGIAAAVVAAGLATLAGVMIGMTETIKQVIDTVSQIRVTPANLKSLDAFIKVLGAIGSFAGDVGGIVEATSPGFTDLIRGGEPMTDRLAQVGSLVMTMANEMRSTIRTLVDQARELAGEDDRALDSAESLSGIISSLGEAAQGLQPRGEFLEVGFIESLGGETVSGRIRELGNYMMNVIRSLRTTIREIVREFAGIARGAGFNEKSVEAARAIGELVGSVGQLGRAMTIFISREYATTDPQTLRALAPQLRTVIEAIMDAVIGDDGTNVFSRMTEVIGFVVDAVSGLNRSQLRAIKIASPIIEATFTAMSAIAALIGNVGLGQAVRGNPEQTKQQIDQLIRVVNAITYGLGNNVKAIITTLASSFGGLRRSQVENIKTGLEAVTDTFNSLKGILDLSQRFKGDQTSMESASLELSGFLGGVEDFLSGRNRTGLKQFAERLPTWLNAIGSQADPIFQALPDFGDTLRYINTTAVAIDRIFNTDAMKAIGDLEEAGIQRIQKGVTAMINNINDFGEALGRVRGINLNSELQALSDRLGLKGTGRLTINQQPVTLNVNFRVTIDSEELEKALIEREGSRFATRGGG